MEDADDDDDVDDNADEDEEVDEEAPGKGKHRRKKMKVGKPRLARLTHVLTTSSCSKSCAVGCR